MDRLMSDPRLLANELVESASSGILMLDADDRVIGANQFMTKLLGCDPRDRNIRTLLHTPSELDHAITSWGKGHASIMNFITHTGLPQSLWVQAVETPSCRVLFCRLDIDEIERMRKQFLDVNAQLQNATRELYRKNAQLDRLNQAKNRFLGMATHDLRKPLGVIMNFAEILDMTAADQLKEEQREYLRHIIERSTFMARIVDEFLDVTLIESGKLILDKSRVSPGEMIHEAIDNVAGPAREKGIELVADFPDGENAVLVDRDRIVQVLMNLLSNAVEYCPEGSQVKVSACPKPRELVLSVEDNGPGMTPEQQSEIFSAFTRSDGPRKKGEKHAGLGLSIANMIVTAHNGRLRVQSQEGKGTEFIIELPKGDENDDTKRTG